MEAIATIDTGAGSVGPSVEDVRPYRPARLGSGIRCPAIIEEPETACESPLTSRLRGGVDSLERPLGEYLCETCGTVFVAITVGLDPRVKFGDVAVDPDDWTARTPAPVGRALRRLERAPKTTQTMEARLRERMAVLEVCTQCGGIFRTDNGEWEAHERVHAED